MDSAGVYWPSPVEWVVFCFVPDKRCPYMPLKKFYTSVVKELTAKSHGQIYTGVNFNKNPSKYSYLNLYDEKSVSGAFAELLVNCAPPVNENIFFVVFIYDKDDEETMLAYAAQIIEHGMFAVAAYPVTYLDYIARTDQNYNKRDVNFHVTIDQLLSDIVQLIVKRKRDLKMDAEGLRGPSPTGVSDMFSGKNSLAGSLDDEPRVMRDDIQMPTVPKPLAVRLAKDFRETSVQDAQISALPVNPDSIRLPKTTHADRQVVQKQHKTLSDQASSPNPKFSASQSSANPKFMTSKKLERPADPVPSTVPERCVFAEHQIVRPSSRVSRSQSVGNLTYEAAAMNYAPQSSPPASNSVEIGSVQTYPVEIAQNVLSFSYQLRQTLSQTDVNMKRNCQSLFKSLELTEGEFYDVIVSHVSGPSEFYVQPYLHGPYLEMLSFCMQLFYSLMDDTDLQLSFENVVRCPDITQIWCAAPFEELDSNDNKRWNFFRARLVKRLSPSIFQVLFVDYGDTAEYNLNNLKVLPESFRQVDGVAIKCRLLQPNIPVATLIEKTESKRNCVLRLEDMSGDVLVVSLFLTDGKNEENLGETLSQQCPAPQRTNPINLGIGRGQKRYTTS